MAPAGSPMYHLFDRIKKCRGALVAWSITHGNSKDKLEQMHKELEALSSMNMAKNLESIQRVRDEIYYLLFQDELFWRQRSGSIWLLAGDKNTKYFHQRASQQRQKNHIHGFMDEIGWWCTFEFDIDRVAKSYF